ncbi:MAG TPA: hypothetical protein DHW07_02810 [Gammaproteobacteria bacterium]|nr:hypothetical protein [Gammaproteobacteria bacterium]|tara:strand:+ start:967 stop:1419 length:453 start_codon:yes stop_codon:yes gene_type:complete
MRLVNRDDRLAIRYRILDQNGVVVEDSDDEPVVISLGDNILPSAVNQALLGQRVGDELRLSINASDEAFGSYDENMIQLLARNEFADVGEISVGMLLEFSMPNGEALAGYVTAIDDEEVSVDFNHPLIGRDCVYEICLVGFADSDCSGAL